MEKKVYTGVIFRMDCNPDTQRKTVCIEIELNELDFDNIKEMWSENESLHLHIMNGD